MSFVSKFATRGVLIGSLAAVGAVTAAAGYPVLGAFIADPNTAATLQVVVAGIASLVAGALPGLKSPTA